MPDIEKIVRPFQLVDTTPATRVLPTNRTLEEVIGEPVVFEIDNRNGSPKKLSCSANSTQTFYCDNKQKMGPNETTTYRIRNPENEDDYVDTEVPNKGNFKRGSGQQYQKDKVKYKPPPSVEQNGEIIGRNAYGNEYGVNEI